MRMEDGPASPDRTQDNSQLYMYVGVKDRSSGATALERNGLVDGKLYVFRSKDPAGNSESDVPDRLDRRRVGVDPATTALTDAQLEAASDAVNAMIFARPEDGAFNLREHERVLLRHHGRGRRANALGRLY